jgi:hypothetical protein
MAAITQLEYEWAESGDKTPAPTDEKIQAGWVEKDGGILEYFNWWMNRADAQLNAQLNYAAGIAVSNLFLTNAPSDTDLDVIGYHPSIGSGSGRWIVASTDTSPDLVYYSDDNGITWSSSSSIGDQLREFDEGAIDSTRYIVPADNATGQVLYSTDGISWTADTGPSTSGATGTARAVVTKYGTSDYVMVGTSTGEIAFCSTGVGGTWVEASVHPPSAGSIRSIIWVSGDIFIAYDSNADTFISSDGGDNWAATAQSPIDIVSGTIYSTSMVYNRSDGVLCATARSSTALQVMISLDNGTSWTVGDVSNLIGVSGVYSVAHVGGKVFVATSRGVSLEMAVSTDNGSTWFNGAIHTQSTVAVQSSIWSNGQMIMIAADDQIFISNSIPNLENL